MSKTRSYHLGKIFRNTLIKELMAGKALKKEIWLSGRIIGVYNNTIVLQDQSGRCELFLEHEAFIMFSKNEVQVGDIIETKVSLQKSYNAENVEEIIFKSSTITLLTPCTTEFFIRTTDPHYRRMLVDQSCKEFLRLRSRIMGALREFFGKEGFLEVETPIMVRLPGMEPYLDVFTTDFYDLNSKKEQRFLITSPEYAMKKLLVGGFEKIFEITRAFRNKETDSTRHNPEFTILEWYRAYADYDEIMKDMEELFAFVACKLFGKPVLHYKGQDIDLTPPWPRIRIVELFEKMANIGRATFENEELFRKKVKEKGYNVNNQTSFDDLFFLVFMNEIEPKLGFGRPVMIYDYPTSMASLSRVCPDNPRYAQRFEAYIAGLELCNGFTELNDPVEQKLRLEQERQERKHLGKLDYPVDDTFIQALELGMPPAGGNALGVDRMVMLYADTENIEDVLAFPWKDLKC